ncbi:DUF86 domain-containing protein [Nodosilinea nodulosa]|uniref:HepT-like ribonuclease domain-containing protein n=1 Tax=Nodosilinea nodulosa TaxID=416001 RepID=UPI00030C2867|nr:DUF86 domain-containing protein [Nodosilinea nodulosa]
MSSRNWRSRVQDILGVIETIQQRINGLDFRAFEGNPILVESVIYQLIVIGEAAANIPPDIKQQVPELPWRQMTDMRNIMAHAYFRVERRIVWETACNNLLPLIQPLHHLLHNSPL